MALYLPTSGTSRTSTRLFMLGASFLRCAVVFEKPKDPHRATLRVFKIERKMYGREDTKFLERVFQKLLINFTWCVRPSFP